jgi:hypothetical protein
LRDGVNAMPKAGVAIALASKVSSAHLDSASAAQINLSKP